MINLKPTKFEAISILVGRGISGAEDGTEIDYRGKTPPSDSAIEAKFSEMLAEWTAQEYARNRQAEYPDYGTQLNKIYDDGLTKWKSEMVDPVKAKWPKDNSGPVE